ncbi:MAG: tryptophan synthase subunit alpha [Pseudomonadota bacterium]
MTAANRIDKRFDALRETSRKALVPYVTAGYPSAAATVPTLHGLVEAGADIIELGLPFSDPMADGPVIQRACESALAQGVGVADVLAMVAAFREDDPSTPIVLMGYLNPVMRYGLDDFAAKAREAGVDGILMVDVPPEEAGTLDPLKAAGIHQIFLLAPTSSDDRVERVMARAGGFVYYVSLTGVTGAGHLATTAVGEHVAQLQQRTDLPVGVGFGIKTPEHAVAVAETADAVVIGSALVELLGQQSDAAAAKRTARDFMAPFRSALDAMTLDRAG